MIADVITAYAAARLFAPRTRRDVERRQKALWRDLRRHFAQSTALRAFSQAGLADIPVTDVADFRSRFEDYFTCAVSREAAERAAAEAEAGWEGGLPGGLHAGFSTGTGGGTRGLYVTSRRERDTYTGLLAGKLATPTNLSGLRRVALCLRAPGRLYEGGHVRFFPLADTGRAAAIAAYDPQLLVAPPQVLLDLAAQRAELPSLRRLYYGAEPLNAVERAFITERLGHRPDPIYQATEGLIGMPCRLGTLHLNEDALIVERDPLEGGRFRPVVTDLLRRTQLVVRLRLDDILKPTTCTCGSPLAAVGPVEGRVGDIWRWGGKTVFPGEVEEQVAACIAPDRAWVATGHAGGIRLACERDTDADVIAERLAAFGQPVTREFYRHDMDFPKRRHVRWAA